MGRTTEAGDLKCLESVAGGEFAVLPWLKTGEWIVNGAELIRPQKVLVRERYSA
jgi:hypothetical protein